MIDADALLKLCKKELSQGRPLENHRSMMTNFIIIMFGVIVGFIIEKGFVKSFIPLIGLIMFQWIFGGLISLKYYGR